jgi:hypothetical protein
VTLGKRGDHLLTTASGPQAIGGIFVCQGHYWTLAYRGPLIRLVDSKGLRQLAHLLRHPGRKIHALDLVAVAEGRFGTIASVSHDATGGSKVQFGVQGDTGEVLDSTARSAYRRRIEQLREEVEEAKRSGDEARALKAEEEIDALAAQLKKSTGPRRACTALRVVGGAGETRG